MTQEIARDVAQGRESMPISGAKVTRSSLAAVRCNLTCAAPGLPSTIVPHLQAESKPSMIFRLLARRDETIAFFRSRSPESSLNKSLIRFVGPPLSPNLLNGEF